MKNIILDLEKKWGAFTKNGHALCCKQMPFISNKAFLNVLYEPQIDAIQDVFEALGATIHPELMEFYKSFNGCRLFFSGLNIFGVQCFWEETYEPFDLRRENYVIQQSFKDDNYVFFASLGGDYAFAYKKDERSKIYAVQKGKKKILKSFDNFNSWFTYYFDALYEEYDDEGQKKHPNKQYKNIPVLYHETCKFF